MGDVINISKASRAAHNAIDRERRKHRQLDIPRWTVMDLVEARLQGHHISQSLARFDLQQAVFTAP